MTRSRLSVRRIAIGALDRLGLLENFFDLRRRVRQVCVVSLATARRRGHVRTIGELRPTQRIIRVGHSWRVADVATSFVAVDLMTSNLRTALDALNAFSIPVFWQPLAEPTRFGVGVTEENRSATWQALRAACAGQSWYVRPLGDAPRSPRLLSSTGDAMPSDLRGADAWHVFREITSPTGLGHHGADASAVIVFWKHRRAQGLTWLVTDVENPVVTAITEDEPGTGEVIVGGRRIATTELFSRYERTTRPRFPVDIVYTWVDGNDPSWLDTRQRALKATQRQEFASSSSRRFVHNLDGLVPARFTSRDELLYSLRSVAQFADFVRRVFIVTDGQIPEWLDPECPDLTIVDHREIFDPCDRRPTFNSHAIESRLHRINGLSEHYIYMNDDVFLGRRVTPSTFFWPSGAAKFFPSPGGIPCGPPDATELSVTSAAKNGRDLLFETVGYLPLQKFKHTPHPQRRSLLYEMETKFAETFSRVASSQFRSVDDVSVAASLHHHYGYATGAAMPGMIAYQYVNLAANNLEDRLDALLDGNYDTWCLNDVDVPPSSRQDVDNLVATWLRSAFPFKSRFER